MQEHAKGAQSMGGARAMRNVLCSGKMHRRLGLGLSEVSRWHIHTRALTH